MPSTRSADRIFPARETEEGAGVRLFRAFGYSQRPLFDPFLMLDDFRAEREEDYRAGFPWHPHRGIETVTYMLEGRVEHGDSLGHTGSVSAGGVQWMTAGSGIIHQEMPKPVGGRMGGFQLWINLPKRDKMREPRYQELAGSEIPTVVVKEGVRVRVICGTIAGVTGPVRDIGVDPEYLDVTLEAGVHFTHDVRPDAMAGVYIIGGKGQFDPLDKTVLENRTMILFKKKGTTIDVEAGRTGVRYLFISGRPIGEPIAWEGPIVMNTQDELELAFEEYRNGTFIRHGV